MTPRAPRFPKGTPLREDDRVLITDMRDAGKKGRVVDASGELVIVRVANLYGYTERAYRKEDVRLIERAR